MNEARVWRSQAALRIARLLAGVLAFVLAPGIARAADAKPAGASSPPPSRDDDVEPEAFARVVLDSAELRTGPGVSHRVLYDAHRGETFALDGRPGSGFWLRVLLPDGRIAYALGDEVQPFAVTPGEEGAPSRPGFLAPPPLAGSRAGFALLGGILSIPVVGAGVQHFGYIEARPSLVLHKTVSLEGFLGDGLTSAGAQLLYGAGVSIYLAPDWPICPFVGMFAGGLSLRGNPSSFIAQQADYYIARAGGGVLFALRNRILVRLEVTNLSVFTADSYKNAQTFSGGLGVYF